MKESTLEKALVVAVKKAGGLCIKLPASSYRGIPDRLVLLPGSRIFFVELKAEDGRLSIHQSRFQNILQTLGFNSYIIQGKPSLMEFIENHVHRPS